MGDWKVGDRVQTDKDDVFRVGVLTAVYSKEVQKTKHDWHSRKEVSYTEIEIFSITVKWDDNSSEQMLEAYDVYPEDSEMERSFRLAVDDAQARIEEKMNEAHKAIREAVAISEETGIPFMSSVSPLSQSYIPDSFNKKFPGVDQDFSSEIAGASGEYKGWQHSAIC